MNGKPAKVKAVSTDDRQLTLWLDDGRVVSAPLSWYPSLVEASFAERKIWQPSGAGHGIHWPALDYDLSVEGILEGRKEHPNALRYVRQARAANQSTGKAHSHKSPKAPRGRKARSRALTPSVDWSTFSV